MIPKKIHYCWFGGTPLPASVQKCIASWETYCPEYEIIQWNETNYDVYKHSYMKEAFESKKYAFVSDYARLDIVFEHGGIYLDTDVELIRNLDELLNNSCFMGYESSGKVATGLGFGAEKTASFVRKNLDEYQDCHFIVNGHFNMSTCIEYTQKALEKSGYDYKNNQLNQFSDVTIYPTEYFAPLNMETQKNSNNF